VRAGLVGPDARLFYYRWSNYPVFVRCNARPAWLTVGTVLGELGLRDDGERSADLCPENARPRIGHCLAGRDRSARGTAPGNGVKLQRSQTARAHYRVHDS
jgi:hypothetical protein